MLSQNRDRKEIHRATTNTTVPAQPRGLLQQVIGSAGLLVSTALFVGCATAGSPRLNPHSALAVDHLTAISDHGSSQEEHGSAESGHDDAHSHNHHLALFLGESFGEGDHDGFTIGADYEYKINSHVGLGALVDRAEGDLETTVYAAALYVHPFDHVTMLVAPGYERAHGEDEPLLRVGGSVDFPIGDRFSLSPAIYVDFISGGDHVVLLGVNLGVGF